MNVPFARAILNEVQLLGNDIGTLGRREVLLVGEDEEGSGGDLLHHRAEGLVRLLDAAIVRRVDDEDEAVRARVVVAPVLAETALAAEVGEAGLLAVDLELLEVKALGGALLGHRIALARQGFQDCSLAGVVEAEDENTRNVFALSTLTDSTEHIFFVFVCLQLCVVLEEEKSNDNRIYNCEKAEK